MSSSSKYFIGIDLGGTKIAAGLANEKGKIIKEIVVPTEAQKGHKEVLEKIKEAIRGIGNKKLKQVKAIGIGSPGTVDYENGIVMHPPNLPGWKEVNLKKIIGDEFKITTYVDNDANCAALAEAKYGAGIGIKNFVYVTLSTGIGGGIVINGKLYRGAIGAAGEVGHISIMKDGKKCSCGKYGHLEGLAAGGAIHRHYGVTAIEVAEGAKEHKSWAFKIINEVADIIGMGFANIINILNPELIIVGGGLSNMGETLLQPIRFALKKYALPLPFESVKVVKAKLGTQAGLQGAVSLCLK